MVSVIIDRASAPGYGIYADLGVYSLTQFGAAIDGVTDDGDEVRAAIAAVGTGDLYLPDGVAYCADDIPGIHELRLRGPGALKVGTGDPWYAEPSRRNTSTSSYVTLYVDPAGDDDANSGLAPEFAFATIQRAFDVLALQTQPLQGYYRIVFAEGVYAGDAVSEWQAGRFGRVEIVGPTVATWDNTDPPDAPVSISSITSANPPVVTTSTSHGRSNGDKVFIGFAARSGGMHASDGKIYTVANVTSTTFELSGINGTGWAAYTSGGKVFDVSGSMPKAIIYGAGASVDGIRIDGEAKARAHDIAAIGCGALSSSNQNTGFSAWNWAWLETYNCHTYFCGIGNMPRENSNGAFYGGYHYGDYVINRAIDARFTFGAANPGSASLTTTPLYEAATFGTDLWEGANGHADGSIYKNCATEIYVRRGSAYCVALDNRYINTGASKAGIIVEGGTLDRFNSLETWTGTYKPRVLVRGGRDVYEANAYGAVWRTITSATGTTNPTPAGGELAVISQTLKQTQMAYVGQALKARIAAYGTWANGNVVFRIKADSTVLHTVTLASNASAREIEFEIEVTASGFASSRGIIRGSDRYGSTNNRLDDDVTLALDTMSADVVLTITAEVVHASDSLTMTTERLEASGW